MKLLNDSWTLFFRHKEPALAQHPEWMDPAHQSATQFLHRSAGLEQEVPPSSGQDHSPLLTTERGMTLVEILIVLAIVGSLLAVVGGNVMGNFQKSKVKETNIKMSQISSAINMYESDCGKIPPTLRALLESPGDDECADWGPEPYLKKDLIKDAWKNDFIYEAEGSTFNLKSYGRDGRPGGSKFDKDITFDDKDATDI